MHDAFRRASGARGIQNVERMIEGQWDKFRFRCRRVRGDEARPRYPFGQFRRLHVRLIMQIGNQNQAFHTGKSRHEFGQLVPHVDRLTVVPVAVAGDQYLGFDLAEAIKHALNAEIRRGAGEDRADAGHRQHRDDGFRQIGQIDGDPVADADATIP